MTYSFIFPGQGSQKVKMLSNWLDTSNQNNSGQDTSGQNNFKLIKDSFDVASEILGFNLLDLTQVGPEEILNQTAKTQPALLTSSVGIWREWCNTTKSRPTLLAGHSLGEYSALVCAGSIDFNDAVKLVENRGKYMQEAVPVGVGAMAAIIGAEDTLIEEICSEVSNNKSNNNTVSIANYNSVGQTVIAGYKSAVELAVSKLKDRGVKRAIILPVSVPSHCILMEEAANKLAKDLENIKISSPKIPVIQNFDVEMHSNPDDIRANLVKQLTSPVRWVDTINAIANLGVNTLVECGPGEVLSGLTRRINKNMVTYSLDEPNIQEILEKI